MSYKLQTSSKVEYIFKDKYQNRIEFSDGKSIGQLEEIRYDDDFSILKSDIFFKEDYEVKLYSDSKNVVFTYLIEGSSKYSPNNHTDDIYAQKDNTTIVMNNYSQGLKEHKKNTHLKSIQFILKNEYLKKLVNEDYYNHQIIKKLNKNTDFVECLKADKTDIQSQMNINQIFNTSFGGSLNKLFLQSKALDILHLELKTLFSSSLMTQNNLKFSEYDIEALHMAKKILLENVESPPSLSKLSKIIKLNEFKLKVGFKKLFDNTPYGLLFEYKMEEAKKLLLNSEYNINEISQKLGYKHSCNFTTAFSKKFGVNPKDIMKTRKYYF